MSAFIVNKDTIDAIVTVWIALESERTGEPAGVMDAVATKLGRMLWSENHRSVNARYAQASRRSPYTFRAVALPARLADALPRTLGAVACLIYQSCEHDDWKQSDACEVLENLRSLIEARVPRVANTRGFELVPQRAGWEIEHRDELTWPLVLEQGRYQTVRPNKSAERVSA